MVCLIGCNYDLVTEERLSQSFLEVSEHQKIYVQNLVGYQMSL